MRRKLIIAGLIFFPLLALFCFLGRVAVMAFNNGPDYIPDRAARYANIYGIGTLFSVLSFIVCLRLFRKAAKK